MIISVFSRLFSIIVAFWAFSILDLWLTFGCVSYEGTNVFSKYWPSKSGCVLYVGKYHVSCEPLRIFWNDDTTCWVPHVLSTTGWKAKNPARSRPHAWHSCRAGCIISENPHGLATHMVLLKRKNTQVQVHIFFRSCKQLLIFFWKTVFFLIVRG